MNQKLSNYQRMISGQEYNYLDAEIMELRKQQQLLNRQANLSFDYQHDANLLPHKSPDANIVLPFYIGYGLHIHLGSQVYINSNVTLQDNAPIHIGAHTMVGPNVQFYTAQKNVQFYTVQTSFYGIQLDVFTRYTMTLRATSNFIPCKNVQLYTLKTSNCIP